MGDGNDRALEILQEAFQPSHRFSIQMVGRFVKDEHVGGRQQQATQRDAAFFTTGKCGNIRIPRRQA